MQIINYGETPEGIIFSDLGALCQPAEYISTQYLCDKWTSIPYETAAVSGTMLSAFSTAAPETVSLQPDLTGWYKIYVSMMDNPANRVFLRLTDDPAQSVIVPSSETYEWTMMKWDRFQEGFWKCADMTGQSVEITKRAGLGTVGCRLGWFRFVPMSEDEIQEWIKEENRKDTKRLFATCDMFSLVATQAPQNHEHWRSIIENMKHSDVDIFSLDEDIVADDFVDTEHGPNSSYDEEVRKVLYLGMLKKNKALYEYLIRAGHESGLKIYLSKRMGAKVGSAYPYAEEYVGREFGKAHPELRCKNRDGKWVDSLSLAYPLVQDHMISDFERMAELDCDGVTLIYTRGIPYVLFEEPVLERFQQQYPGVNPRELPLADERVHGLHCEIMTEFMRKLRRRLDETCKRLGRRPLAIHAYVGSSLEENRQFALDVEEWAREGLVNSISVYPLAIRERLEGLMQEDHPELIDLEKYRKASRESFHKIIHRDIEHMWHIDPRAAKEYVQMCKKYGVKVYVDLLDRLRKSEDYVADALEFIEQGVENFSLWDCEARAEVKAEWETASRLGHIEELKGGGFTHNAAHLYRILQIGGRSIELYSPSWMT